MAETYNIEALTAAEKEAAEMEFNRIDADKNGLLDEKELRSYLSKKPELRCFPKLIMEFFGSNGTITFEQFEAFYKSFAAKPEDDGYLGKIIFDKIDTDGSGSIDNTEFMKVWDLVEAPNGQKYMIAAKVAAQDMNYEAFKREFFKLLKMAWVSSGFRS